MKPKVIIIDYLYLIEPTNKKVPCPFCKPNDKAIRGDGCCNCDHSGLVPYGEDHIFKSEDEALNHDPEISYFDLKDNRAKGLPNNYKPF